MILATIIICVDLSILVHNNLNENKVEKVNLDIVDSLEKSMEPYSELNDQGLVEKDFSWLEEDISIGTKYSKKINDVNYIGILYFPSIDNLSISVIDECTDKNLKIAGCRYSGNIDEGNIVIAGHNYKSIFGRLSDKLEIGSNIYFKSLDGTVYKYTLNNIEELEADDVQRMQEGDWDLTLFTCDYYGNKRTTFRFLLEN